MRPFDLAAKDNPALQTAARADIRAAADIWRAVTGQGTPTADTMAESIRETAPPEHAALLATNESAAALAFGLLWTAPRYGSAFERREAAREAWEKFTSHASTVEEMAEGFGWDASEAWARARDVSPKNDGGLVARVARLAGRMFVALRGSASKRIPGVPGEVFSVELGGNVERLLPEVYGALLDDERALPALYDVATRRAPQYAVRGTSKTSRGPLVFTRDESGSMHGPRNEWAAAAAVAMSRVAAEQGRRVSVVHFSTSTHVADLDPRNPEHVLAMIRFFMGGGTNIAHALGRALDEVERLARAGDKGADVILVTDGVDPDDAGQGTALDRAAKMNARLWTVAIECEIDTSSPLRARAASYSELGREGLGDARTVSLVAAAA